MSIILPKLKFQPNVQISNGPAGKKHKSVTKQTNVLPKFRSKAFLDSLIGSVFVREHSSLPQSRSKGTLLSTHGLVDVCSEYRFPES